MRKSNFDLSDEIIAIIGLGYVGLPVALEFGKKTKVIAFDTDKNRVKSLKSGVDKTGEFSQKQIRSAKHIHYTTKKMDLGKATVYIVTVPTPIDINHQPDLTSLKNASRTIASVLSPGNVIVYESTVYPGATEEECVPVLELVSKLKFNVDFYVGYSPERLNPGDKKHTITKIKKVTSGSTSETAEFVDQLYNSIIEAGTYKVSSIKVAEAAKVIENTQRDLNIALINELAIIFDRLGINTHEVLDAASTKWNFLPFTPGLVGGHCIGIDPYYLTYKAESSGYHPDVILAGRKINDGMGKYVVSRLVREMIRKRIHVNGSNILILGFAFKENCSDIRNTKIVDIMSDLLSYDALIDVYDPEVSIQEVKNQYGFEPLKMIESEKYDAVIFAVAHEVFRSFTLQDIKSLCKEKYVVYDIKNSIREQCDSVIKL